jgi:hypothetical protein
MAMAITGPRVIADATLGHLAKWLRLLGVDTLYERSLRGTALMEKARSDRRILLTRDTRLIRRRDVPPHIFVRDNDFRSQIRQVVRALGLHLQNLLTRCALCNEELVPVEKAQIEGEVPPYVFQTQDRFVRCARCKRIYWHATHAERIRAEIERVFSDGA